MKILGLIFIAIVFQIIYRSETKQISCEKILIYDYINKIHVKDCHMHNTTSIDSPNIAMFTRDNSMEGMLLNNNNNLITLRASNCNIKDISRRNFRGLTKLKEINLYLNQIEKIVSGTFEGLEMLEELSLGLTEKV
jgi:Leucine-rich repeat (LRR) protein